MALQHSIEVRFAKVGGQRRFPTVVAQSLQQAKGAFNQAKAQVGGGDIGSQAKSNVRSLHMLPFAIHAGFCTPQGIRTDLMRRDMPLLTVRELVFVSDLIWVYRRRASLTRPSRQPATTSAARWEACPAWTL